MTYDVSDLSAYEFGDDRPIESKRQDLLGRHPFAEIVANQTLSTPRAYGFVAAIVGEWGCGKSSLLNMIDEILSADDCPVTVLRFNPWLFGGAEDLVVRFFGELSAQIRHGATERLRNVGIGLLKMGQLLASFSPTPGAAVAATVLGNLAQSRSQNPSLIHTRNELSEALAEADSKFVILIDDVDRLHPNEIREVLRLIRLTSDLPNITYILAFDWHRVAKSLAKEPQEGQQFLEKIVQFKINVPQVRRKNLESWLFAGLDGLIGSKHHSLFDSSAWVRVYPELIKPLIRNLRDAKRLLFSLTATLDALNGEIALVDVLGLESIRVIKPHLFDELRASADYLTLSDQREQSFVVYEKSAGEISKALKDLVNRPGEDGELLRAAFELLFPATQEFLGGRRPSEYSERAWRKDRRVASRQILRIYLESGIAEGSVPVATIQELFDSLTDEAKFAGLIDALTPSQMAEALERLEAYEYEYPSSAIENATPVLLNRMGRLNSNTQNFFDFSERFRAERVIFRLLRAEPDMGVLARKLNVIFDKVDSLSGLLVLVNTVAYRETDHRQFIDERQSEALEKRLVCKLRIADTNLLLDEWNPAGLAINSVAWSSESEKGAVRNVNRRHLAKAPYVVAVLRSCVGGHYSNGKSELRFQWDILLETFGPTLNGAVLGLDPEFIYRPGEDDQEVIEVAQKYARGWRPEPFLGVVG